MAGINGNFAAGLNSGLQNGIRAIFAAPQAREQAELQGGLLGAQTAAARTKAELDQQKLDLVGRAVSALNLPGLDQREQYNYLIGAANGQQVNPFEFDFKTGTSANKATGAMNAAEPALRAIYGDQANAAIAAQRAQAANSYASAGAHNAAAAATRATIGMPRANPNLRYDPSRGVIVDISNGTAAAPTMAGGAPLPAPNNPAVRPLPLAATRMQNDTLEALGLIGSINADLGAMQKQIDDGVLDLGPVANRFNEARNAVGMSDESSRAYASFLATLEKMRNDSLRLNKGVQTEGDAQRAWNELFANMNDPNVVSQRLGEIIRINQRAGQLKGMANDQMLANFGHDPMDYSPYLNVGPAVGMGNPPAAAPAAAPPAAPGGGYSSLWGD